MLVSRGSPGRSRNTSEQQNKCLDPNRLPGVGRRWVRESYNTRSLRESAAAEECVGKDTCSKEVIHKVDDLLPRDLCGSICFHFCLLALLNEGVGDVSDVVLRGREDKSWQQNQWRNGCY